MTSAIQNWSTLLFLTLLFSVAACEPTPPTSDGGDADQIGSDADQAQIDADQAQIDADQEPVELWTARPANNRDYLPIALEMINGAERRIHMVEYVIYPGGPVQEILDALIAAADRGVEVMVLADETGDSTAGALEMLREGGVDARLDDPSVLTHNKLIIVDDQVLLGSANLTNNALDRNNESSIQVSDANVASFYETYFQALWADPVRSPSVRWRPNTRLVPLTDRDIFGAYLGCLESSEREVMLLLYAMRYSSSSPGSSYNQLVDAVIDAHRRGVQVEVVLDASDWITSNEINDRAIALLQESGVPLRSPPASRITHAKMLICDDTVIVSDANWASSALERYHGSSLQVTDVTLAEQYREYFRSIFDQSSPP